MVDWNYFDRFDDVQEKYLPSEGEGDSKAEQIVTCTSKLIYKWYNDGDVFDNTHYLEGWGNDLSDYANWLYKNVPETDEILDRIAECHDDNDYSELLKDLADITFDEKFLSEFSETDKVGTIYECKGDFQFVDNWDDDDYDDYEDDPFYDYTDDANEDGDYDD